MFALINRTGQRDSALSAAYTVVHRGFKSANKPTRSLIKFMQTLNFLLSMLLCCKKYLKVGPHIPKIVFSPLGECEPTDGYDSQHRAAKHTALCDSTTKGQE